MVARMAWSCNFILARRQQFYLRSPPDFTGPVQPIRDPSPFPNTNRESKAAVEYSPKYTSNKPPLSRNNPIQRINPTFRPLIIIMLMKVPNENSANFRIRSFERPFSKTDAFTHCKSLHKQGLPLHHRTPKHPTLKCGPAIPPSPPKPNLNPNELKRIIPRNLRPVLPCQSLLKKCLPTKAGKQSQDLKSSMKVEIDYSKLKLCEDSDVDPQMDTRRAFWPPKGKMVAVKVFKCLMGKPWVKALTTFEHPNVLELLGQQESGGETFVLMDWMDCGNLQTLIDSFGPLPLHLVKKITKHVVGAVEYLHSKGHTHGNIKAAKVFLNQLGETKLSIAESDEISPITSDTPLKQILWCSPERILQGFRSKESDIWGIGCLVLQMLTGKRPWCYQSTQVFRNSEEFIKVVETQKIPTLPKVGREVEELLEMCLRPKPCDRASAKGLGSCRFLLGSDNK